MPSCAAHRSNTVMGAQVAQRAWPDAPSDTITDDRVWEASAGQRLSLRD